MLSIKPKQDCMFDQLSIGEVMLRLDPGEQRIRNSRHFTAWEGGGEYNVARGLSKCFNLRAAIVTALAGNDIGRLIEDLIMQGGVDTRFVKWMPYDGIGRNVRNGINFTERGFGLRGALGVSDRANSAASNLKPGDIDWDYIFGECGVRWFHTGGIFAALSDTTADVILEAAKSAKKNNTIISYDLNYRPSLWKAIGGKQKACDVNSEIVKYVDVLFGNEEDFTACLGIEIDGNSDNFSALSRDGYKNMMDVAAEKYPNLKIIASTLREVKTANRNNWSAICMADGKLYDGMELDDLDILDRVGGGDSFASGFIYALLSGMDCKSALDYGICHGALAMTTPGDTSMASLGEVQALVDGSGARVER